MFKMLGRFRRNDRGTVAIEYALAAAVFALALIPAIGGLSTSVGEVKDAIGVNLAQSSAVAVVKSK